MTKDTIQTIKAAAKQVKATEATAEDAGEAQGDTREQTQGDIGEEAQGDTKGQGDNFAPPVPLNPAAAGSRARSVDVSGVFNRLNRDGRWKSAEVRKQELYKEARKAGVAKDDRQQWVYQRIDAEFPPPEPVNVYTQTPNSTDGQLQGIGDIPAEWLPLPDNASQQAELSWCQAQRLRVCSTEGATTHVHLERATQPAPSMSALSWLETSVRSYAKYIDIVGRVLAGQQEAADMVRRERASIEEIRALLDEMHKD